MNHRKHKSIGRIFSYVLLIVMLSSLIMPSPLVQATEDQDTTGAQYLAIDDQDELKEVQKPEDPAQPLGGGREAH